MNKEAIAKRLKSFIRKKDMGKLATVGSSLRIRAMRAAGEKAMQKRSRRRGLAAGAMLGAAGVLGAQKAMQAHREGRHA